MKAHGARETLAAAPVFSITFDRLEYGRSYLTKHALADGLSRLMLLHRVAGAALSKL